MLYRTSRAIVVAIFSMVVPVTTHAATAMASADKLARLQPRIVNGILDHGHYTTGMLASSPNIANAALVCSGTLIGCNTFLTAAHCVEADTNPASYGVFLQHAGFFGVRSITVHPSYAFPVADVAVLKLSSNVTGIAPTKINTTAKPGFGSVGEIVGFGRTSTGGDESGLKYRGNVSIGSCSGAGVSDTTSVCWTFADPIGSPGTDSNTCNGDSGGPLFVDFGSGPVVAGITSGGEAIDCLPTDVSYDANVHHYRAWIQQEGGSDLANLTCGGGPQAGDADTDVYGASGVLNSANRDDQLSFQVIPGADRLRVTLNAVDDGSSDFDIYVRAGSPATTTTYDCKADGSGQLGFCSFENPVDGTWYVLVNRAAGSGTYQVTATTFGSGCEAGQSCDDGKSCTTNDTCNAGICSGTPVGNGTPCNDGNACTLTDACQSGSCVGSGSTCGDGTLQSCEQCDDGNTSDGDACRSDCTLPAPADIIDAVVLPIKPLSITIADGSAGTSKDVRVKVRNGNLDDIGGQTIGLSAADGDCPAGTISGVGYGSGGTAAFVEAGKSVSAKVSVTVSAAGFTTLGAKSPARCTALVIADGGSGDAAPSNNVAPLVIDVVDRND